MRVDIILIDSPVTVLDGNARLCLATPSVLALTVIGPNNDTSVQPLDRISLYFRLSCQNITNNSSLTTTQLSSCLLNTDKKPVQFKAEDI